MLCLVTAYSTTKKPLKTRVFSFSLNSSSSKTHVSPVLWAFLAGSFDDSNMTCSDWFWLLFQNLTKNTHFGFCCRYKTFRLHSVIVKLSFYVFPFPLRLAPPADCPYQSLPHPASHHSAGPAPRKCDCNSFTPQCFPGKCEFCEPNQRFGKFKKFMNYIFFRVLLSSVTPR